jgi:hypothetical protein
MGPILMKLAAGSYNQIRLDSGLVRPHGWGGAQVLYLNRRRLRSSS